MTVKRRWPAATDYIDAVQHPAHVFTRPGLMDAQFDLDAFGIPDGCTGSNAVVFRAVLGQRTAALRCFTSQAGLSRERYLALARHWVTERERGRSMVPATWWDDSVRVKGELWPLVEMDWVNGRPLDVYVGFLCESRPDSLHVVADHWRAMLSDLGAARAAHGDLQHGNVLVDQASELRLVDLDSAWVPDMDGLDPPNEAGHQAFRHPNRAQSHEWGPHMDLFAGLVVYTSLKALAHRPDLWTAYNNGDNLIFTARDFVEVGSTALWADLSAIRDTEVVALVHTLRRCCEPAWQPRGTLDELIESGAERPVMPVGPRAAIAAPAQPVPAPLADPSTVLPLTGDDYLVYDFDWEIAPAPAASAVVSMPGPAAPPAHTMNLPPPPIVQRPTLHAPVANPVAIAAGPASTHAFARPPGANALWTPAATPSASRTMASGFMGWAIAAVVMSVLLGLPALIMARRADAARNAGDMERAVRLSHISRRWSIAVVILVAVLSAVLVVAQAIAASQSPY